jgi:hypothetical protein
MSKEEEETLEEDKRKALALEARAVKATMTLTKEFMVFLILNSWKLPQI